MICESDTDDYPRALKLVPNWFVKLNLLEYYLDIETVKPWFYGRIIVWRSSYKKSKA